MGFKEFVTEDSDAVISQIRQIRDQMRVIKLIRDLERERRVTDSYAAKNRSVRGHYRYRQVIFRTKKGQIILPHSI